MGYLVFLDWVNIFKRKNSKYRVNIEAIIYNRASYFFNIMKMIKCKP